MNLYLDQVITGIFLLILAVSGNFIAEILGCKTQKLLTENMLAKHFISLLLVYFAINFTSSNDQPPTTQMKLALIIYIGFILFTKMNIYFTVLVFALLATIYISNNYIKFYKSTDKKNPEIQRLNKLIKLLYKIVIGLILLGFGLYFIKQRREYSKNWSTTKFLFGVRKCKSIQ